GGAGSGGHQGVDSRHVGPMTPPNSLVCSMRPEPRAFGRLAHPVADVDAEEPVPAPSPAQLGPLPRLPRTWQPDRGLDLSFHHLDSEVGETRFRERVTMNPFGPVDNGTQSLFGLDYRMAAWRGDESDPFHTEVGYWLWDAADGQVMRCFMVPRGTVV